MRKEKYLLTMDDEIYDLILESMIYLKNKLMSEGRYTDAVDDAMLKFLKSKRKYI